MSYLRKASVLLILVLCAFWWCPSPVLALSAELTIDHNQLEIGAITQIRITVYGSLLTSRPEIPQQPGLLIKYLGPFTQRQFVNGVSTVQITYNYSVQAKKSGVYQLGPYTLSCGKEELTTNSLELTVNDQPQTADQPVPEKQKDKALFLELTAAKTQLYLGESLPIQVRLYIGNVSVQDLTYPTIPPQAEVIVSEATKPTEQKKIINGMPYQILTFSRTVTPVKTGAFTLDPVELSCNVIEGPISNDPFFNLFERYEKRPVTLRTNHLALEVLPLPATQRPNDFSGGIGHFNLKLTASPLTVQAGDPLTVRISITGEGNLTSTRPPSFPADAGFKIYDPQRIDQPNPEADRQEVLYEQVVIPLHPEVQAIPALSLSYFDPEAKEYRRVWTEPLPITVLPNPDFSGNMPPSAKKDVTALTGRDLVYIKTQPGNLRQQGTEIYKNLWFWGWQLLPVLLFVFTLCYRRRQELLSSDTAHGRALRAQKAAEKELGEIKERMAKDHPQQLLTALHRLLREYLGGKFNLSPAGITVEVCTDLEALGVTGEILEEIKDFFSSYDYYQFTAATIDRKEVEALWGKLYKIVSHLAAEERPRKARTQKWTVANNGERREE